MSDPRREPRQALAVKTLIKQIDFREQKLIGYERENFAHVMTWESAQHVRAALQEVEALAAERDALRSRVRRLEEQIAEKNLSRVDGVPEGAHGDLPRPATE